MPSGIQFFARDGRLVMDGTGRYPRVVDVIDLSVVGTPGSRSYPLVDPATLNFVLYQGGNRARIVWQSDTTLSWTFANEFGYGVFGGTPKLVVVTG
ncbi:hypothetical protein [Pseudomonas gingeri]|uniref:hypothetical protein n=1 Tax=Pseudomonas gingeri TaxID=117681 RepID=UPI0015A17A75|nr:hypothetical protein [Pseudomonas gingeri]NWE49454.1 hypothetical protein [Pseudomonas gingeri]NWE69930.1 hypothetical protein [Pseudomonas gingeri]